MKHLAFVDQALVLETARGLGKPLPPKPSLQTMGDEAAKYQRQNEIMKFERGDHTPTWENPTGQFGLLTKRVRAMEQKYDAHDTQSYQPRLPGMSDEQIAPRYREAKDFPSGTRVIIACAPNRYDPSWGDVWVAGMNKYMLQRGHVIELIGPYQYKLRIQMDDGEAWNFPSYCVLTDREWELKEALSLC